MKFLGSYELQIELPGSRSRGSQIPVNSSGKQVKLVHKSHINQSESIRTSNALQISNFLCCKIKIVDL